VVHLDAPELGPLRKVGELRRIERGPGAAVAFSYDPDWLAQPSAFPIDPALQLFEGPQYTADARLAGVFNDAAPDRWGRKLLDRREAAAARALRQRARALDEWDYLVGVTDLLRVGALRFESEGRFLDDHILAVPPAARLRELEHYAREFERGNPLASTDEQRWIAMLLAPGSSLGGTRPKASFQGDDGLWIAKFPSGDDSNDVGAWEYVLTQLAQRAGIATVPVRLIRLSADHRTFASRRFDRVGKSRRMYASAMTLTQRRDGEGASYLDLALAISDFGAPEAISEDLEQLFRRAAFNVLVSNRDDHLRNHGFLRTTTGWRLAPTFDLNPAPAKAEHSLRLNEDLALPDPSLVEETAAYYRLSPARAHDVLGQVRAAVAGWREVAADSEIARDELEMMSAAFPT